MKYIFLSCFAFGALLAGAQKKGSPETYAKTITAADAKRQLYIVAGPEMEGRETATPGQKKAAAYIESQFKSFGLLPGNNGSYQMMYDVYQDSVTSAAFEVNGIAFQPDRDFNAAAGNFAGTLRFSEVVLIGSGSMDTLKNANLSGRLVLLMGGMPQGRGMGNSVYGTLISKGVGAILTVGTNYPRTAGMSNKGAQSTSLFRRNISPQIYTISEAVAKSIVSDFDEAKNNTKQIKTYMANVLLRTDKTTVTTTSSNVVAMLPGTDLKDQYLFVTAHYDHLGKRGDSVIYYGADDDGSGTVGVLEIAEAFSKAKAAGNGPRRTMIFMTVSGEEKGLWGSDYYSSHPIFPLDRTTADLNIDMIGRIDGDRKQGDSTNYVYVVGDDKLSSDLRAISEMVNKKNAKLELDYKFNDPNDTQRIYYRSDHYNFAKKGVPIIFYYDGMLKADYHRPTDTPDKINYDLLARRAKLVFYTAWEMANRTDMLKRDIPLDANVFIR